MAISGKDSFWFWGGGLGVLLVVAGIALYIYERDRGPADVAPPAPPPPAASAPAAPEPAAAPATAPASRPTPLPNLDESDAEVVGGLTELVGRDALQQFLVPQRIIRNIVVTIDNLPREKVAVNQRPIKPTPGKFIVTGPEDAREIASENYSRYTPLVAVVKRVDARTLAAFYRGLQPLFQQAYEELGNPSGSFNARLLQVIDHLLQTPDVQQPVQLVQPSVTFKYADPKLESLSSGQKLLIRMGPTNAGAIKAKLREVRAALS
ncbi:MAG TPA: DUF3014 domain-containing protein [Gammaproteobacteria bacterium]|nr:DUF3014 domain-containing protein [Gammaproteobacteria bacterium]